MDAGLEHASAVCDVWELEGTPARLAAWLDYAATGCSPAPVHAPASGQVISFKLRPAVVQCELTVETVACTAALEQSTVVSHWHSVDRLATAHQSRQAVIAGWQAVPSLHQRSALSVISGAISDLAGRQSNSSPQPDHVHPNRNAGHQCVCRACCYAAASYCSRVPSRACYAPPRSNPVVLCAGAGWRRLKRPFLAGARDVHRGPGGAATAV
jgi:hypothetical protein